ncbi:hypothetical protein C2S53_005247 [Perilla frutescens var. hirtella]|uniref:Uncharacterized protein n=1 Tax=Perilla frutescens var. hirtella TaxID=608512 RepID=A0AAD4JP95_PERFH|nr:hypothetical protein C2S53_005247 [Perilla frutescens var. hirtella]
MKLLKPLNNQSIERRKRTDRFTFITDDRVKLVIPVGPRFQVDVPSWTPPSSRSHLTIGDTESDNAKWLGNRTWPLKGKSQDTNNDMIGRGRPRTCVCSFPGSIQCVRRHVSDKKFQLKIDLGPAFWKWKFDGMGEDVTKLWNENERRKFDYILKMNLTSKGKGFMKSASQNFPFHSEKSIVSYYLNVHIPRRISVQTRSVCNAVDTDDDDHDDGEEILSPTKGSRKRLHADFTCSSRKYIKTAFLTSCRRVRLPLNLNRT